MMPLNKLNTKLGKNSAISWTEDEKESFRLVKHAIIHAPQLKFIDWSKALALVIDASKRGVGALLYQPDQPGDAPTAENVVSFTSRALLKHERNYHAYKLELLGFVYAIVTYEHYLAGVKFTVYTDHRALTFLLTQAGSNRILGNWLSLLLEFRFTVVHLPGYDNFLADFLSRAYPSQWGVGDQANAVRRFLSSEYPSLGALTVVDFDEVVLGILTRSQKSDLASAPSRSDLTETVAVPTSLSEPMVSEQSRSEDSLSEPIVSAQTEPTVFA